jgi:hypothetical protein
MASMRASIAAQPRTRLRGSGRITPRTAALRHERERQLALPPSLPGERNSGLVHVPPGTGVSRRMARASGRGDHGVMPVIFRRGTEADARAAADLWLRARKSAIDVIPPPIHRDDEVRAWFASHVVRNTELWLAEDPPGALVGIGGSRRAVA